MNHEQYEFKCSEQPETAVSHFRHTQKSRLTREIEIGKGLFNLDNFLN